jgi:Ni/Co efflux regulator RcnB
MNKKQKRILLTAAASFFLAGTPLIQPAFAQQPRSQRSPQPDNPPRQDDRRDSDRRDSDGRDSDRRDSDGRGSDRRDSDRADDGRDDRREWRDTRRDARWDSSRHNGYFVRGQWRYGEPDPRDYRRADFALGYHPWARGDHLGSFNRRYAQVDYRAERLERPRRGYRWVRDDRGVFLQAAVSSGLIITVVNRNSR